jgi:NADPH-dependent 2,4-dienoyl-CoA reductase/sulfur reductase-like enzyme
VECSPGRSFGLEAVNEIDRSTVAALISSRQRIEGAVRLRTDVLIIGAGPAGLALAALLAVHGVDFQILDKSGPLGQSGAALVQCSS